MITTPDLVAMTIVVRAFDINDLIVSCFWIPFFSSLQYYRTCSHVLLLSNGENPAASWPNSIPEHGAKIDTDPHTSGRIASQ